MTFRTTLWRAFRVKALGLTILTILAVPYLSEHATLPGDRDTIAMDSRPAGPGTPRDLVERHGCWTGAAPEGAIPGHVVVTKGQRTFLGGPRLVDQALTQVFDGEEHGLSVHAFCP